MRRLTVGDLRDVGLKAADLTAAGRDHPRRTESPVGVVVHSPGVTWVDSIRSRRRCRVGDAAGLDAACAAAMALRRFQPGYLIGQDGTVYALERDDRRTSHAGGRKVALYRSGEWLRMAKPLGGKDGYVPHGRDPAIVYDWYLRQYGGTSPASLLGGRPPNDAIGIDLRPALRKPRWTGAQLDALRLLIGALALAHGFELDAHHVTTHSMIAPMERGTVFRRGKIIGTPWDPGGGLSIADLLGWTCDTC